MVKQYAKPPITEAVIDIQLRSKMSDGHVKQVSKKILKFYERSEEMRQGNFTFNFANAAATTAIEFDGNKMISADGADLAIVRKAGLLISRLAPYEGWSNLSKRFTRDWEFWKTRILPNADECRLGVRFVNRIDIPHHDNGPIRLEDFFEVHIRTPNPDMRISEYTVRFRAPLAATQFQQIITISTVPAPLIGHSSFLFDIDVFSGSERATQGSIFESLERIHDLKNDLFETYLSAKAKELFA